MKRLKPILLWAWGLTMFAFLVFNSITLIVWGEIYDGKYGGWISLESHPFQFICMAAISVLVTIVFTYMLIRAAFMSKFRLRAKPWVDQRTKTPTSNAPSFKVQLLNRRRSRQTKANLL